MARWQGSNPGQLGQNIQNMSHLPMALSKLLAQIQRVIKELVINEKDI